MENNTIFYTPPVEDTEKNLRLDKFIAEKITDFSRSQIQRLILEGNVFVDDEVILDKNFKTRIGDIYQIYLPEPTEANPIAQDLPIDVLYEDDDLIVVNKEAGMTVHPAAGVSTGTLVNALLYHCKNSLSGIGGVARPGIVHRIDRNTSGILVVAKNDFAHRDLAQQFFEHSIERTYFAIVYSVPNPLKGTIEGNIIRSPYDRKKMAITLNGGKTAITHYETIESFRQSASLIKCNLETGRTHQIRVHLSSIGCHLIGDNIYTKPRKTSIVMPLALKNYVNSFPRQALHASSLGFVHPRTKQKLSFRVDMPQDMRELLQALKNYNI